MLWLDPFRGYLGAWLLISALGLTPSSWEMMPKLGLSVLLGVICLSALSQTLSRRDHGVVLAPIGFVSGVVVAIVPGVAPFICLAIALLAMFGFRQFYAFFAIGVIALPLLGFVFASSFGLIAAALPMFFVPLMVGMLTHSSFEIPWHVSESRQA